MIFIFYLPRYTLSNWYRAIVYRATQLFVVRQNCLSCDTIVCRATQLFVVRHNCLSCDTIVCRATQLFVVRHNCLSCKTIVCRATQFLLCDTIFVVRHNFCRATQLYGIKIIFHSGKPGLLPAPVNRSHLKILRPFRKSILFQNP
jgi:hypothetical protein